MRSFPFAHVTREPTIDMTIVRAHRDRSPRRDGDMGLVALVLLILAGTAWTVAAFVQSSPSPVQAASPACAPAMLSAGDCDECDAQTLAPLPSWQRFNVAPDVVLRATSLVEPQPVRARRSLGAVHLPWAQVSAPVADEVNG